MGATVDSEADGQQNGTASGDDAAGSPDDEDGVTVSDLTMIKGAGATVRVNATNTGASGAMLYGWVDFNGNGVFEVGERATVIVPVASNNIQFTLNFGTAPSNAVMSTFARFRLSTDVAAANPTGAATDGEVEDYPVVINAVADLGITKAVTPSTYTLGSTTNVTYTFTVTNYGPSDVSLAPVTDTQPANVTFNTWTCAITAAGTGSVTNACGAASGTGNIATTATLKNGAVATFTINAAVGDGATGTVTNTALEALPVSVTQDSTINRPDTDTADVTPVSPSVSLGNQIFYDTNNNGLRDAGELGINGVTVELYADADMNGTPDTAFPLARVTTATGTTGTATGVAGMYLFTQQTLDPATGNPLGAPVNLTPGKYVVCIPATMFNSGQPLSGYLSSQTSKDAAGAGLTETAPPDPNAGGRRGFGPPGASARPPTN